MSRDTSYVARDPLFAAMSWDRLMAQQPADQLGMRANRLIVIANTSSNIGVPILSAFCGVVL